MNQESQINELSKALERLSIQAIEDMKFRHDSDERYNKNLSKLESSCFNIAEKLSVMSELVAILVSQKKDTDLKLGELKADLKENLSLADRTHDKMDKTAKDYTDVKAKNLRTALDFRTRIGIYAFAAMLSASGIAVNYVIDDFKEEIAFNRHDIKENKLALSNKKQ